MLNKIIFRSCILAAFTMLFACVPDEVALPKAEAEALLATDITADMAPLLEATNTQLISTKYIPTECEDEACSTMLPKLSKHYQHLANETCEVQWYAATCCMGGQLTTVLGKAEPNSERCSTIEGQDNGSATMPIPNLTVAILPNHCINGGATLWAINPEKKEYPPYSEAFHTVKWYRNGELIGNGAFFQECVCGEKVSVTVTNTLSGAQGSAIFLAPPCVSVGG